MAEEVSTSVEQSAEEGDQEVVTLGEVLQNEQQMMDDANAVLGALDDKKCTYSEGYMKRQALYSCLTCIPEAKTDPSKAAGVCLACCYYCHEGHELVELYTKRNFRCDCGNQKFSNHPCNLDNTKADLNELNDYNQNFTGVYCTCKRPYPDPEDPISDEMIQCIICEDWYHTRHLGVEIPAQNEYSEMSCEACVKKHPFLLHYDGLCATKITLGEENNVEVTEQTDANKPTTADEAAANTDAGDSHVENLIKTEEVNQTSEDVTQNLENTEVQTSDEQSVSSDQTAAKTPNSNGLNELDPPISSTAEICKKPKTKSDKPSSKFWTDVDWRKQLCNCPECLRMYEEENVMFLLDPQDTVQVYEEKGKEKAREFEAKQHENDMKFLNSLDRVPLMEAIAGFNDLKTNLMEYLKKFAENKKIVREEDIREFFAKYDTKKKQKCEVPHYCR